ncbi:hypothetical protein NDU88_001927, partial [Pleurodeles waltl]
CSRNRCTATKYPERLLRLCKFSSSQQLQQFPQCASSGDSLSSPCTRRTEEISCGVT